MLHPLELLPVARPDMFRTFTAVDAPGPKGRSVRPREGKMVRRMLARGLGMSPVEFRLINCLKPGLTTATGQVVNEGTGIGATLLRIRDYMSQHGLEWSR